ncbi:MAG: hypothetical protein QOK36_2866, partial [Gaiellales bacterium]|nr:hypothetical protein [Gaiellales bacterium]
AAVGVGGHAVGVTLVASVLMGARTHPLHSSERSEPLTRGSSHAVVTANRLTRPQACTPMLIEPT